MAREIETKKRKASAAVSGAEKVKKAKKVEVDAPAKKRKATEDADLAEVKKPKTTPIIVSDKPSKAKPTKKGVAATDELETSTNGAAKAPKRSKKGAATEPAEATTNGDSKVSKVTKKSSKASKKADIEPEVEEPIEEGAEEDDNGSEVDDQTEALLKGFESDGDEEDDTNEEGLPAGQEVPKVELSKKDKKKLQKAAEEAAGDKPGVVYVGRIPHGFYENEMKEYFKQFGTILKLRLSRNRKTGASRHFAFIQFESATVADIVSKTMDNYLLFGHLLKVKIVPDEQVPEELFKGANRRFKKVPWNKLEGRKLKQGATEEVWERRIEQQEAKRSKKAAALKEIGYEFEAPKIKSAKGLAKKQVEAPAAIENGEEAPSATEAALVAADTDKPKKGKKAKARKVIEEVVAEELAAVIEEEAEVEKPKEKKAKKSKALKAVELAVEEVPTTVEEPSKPKKIRKAKKEKS
ncbi:hypothetical protein BGZ60DRAFT_426039 [Tricladium varicosporioides]|nr:hypothetical protein BGZ60DRAFT_426039 [Hymenoscyphus varicosporioides]